MRAMSIIEWLWSFLPDNCEAAGCCRKGVRGNENMSKETGMVLCDYCSSREHDGQKLTWRK